MTIIEFIKAIIDRPAMYSVNNVEDLYLIIIGYNYGAKSTEVNNFLSDFRDIVNKYFKSKNDIDWPRLIRFNSSSDKHSIEIFSEIFLSHCER